MNYIHIPPDTSRPFDISLYRGYVSRAISGYDDKDPIQFPATVVLSQDQYDVIAADFNEEGRDKLYGLKVEIR